MTPPSPPLKVAGRSSFSIANSLGTQIRDELGGLAQNRLRPYGLIWAWFKAQPSNIDLGNIRAANRFFQVVDRSTNLAADQFTPCRHTALYLSDIWLCCMRIELFLGEWGLTPRPVRLCAAPSYVHDIASDAIPPCSNRHNGQPQKTISELSRTGSILCPTRVPWKGFAASACQPLVRFRDNTMEEMRLSRKDSAFACLRRDGSGRLSLSLFQCAKGQEHPRYVGK
uniref:Uncharacterized protein n=1 Tax=Psilocybe cubensis TaxID=181762 RepID=A0A8H8CG64_PSICU